MENILFTVMFSVQAVPTTNYIVFKMLLKYLFHYKITHNNDVCVLY